MTTKVVAIVLLAIGAAIVLSGPVEAAPPAVWASPRSPWSAFAAGLLPVLFTYGGWQMVSYVAPQVEDAPRTLPRAIFVGVVLVAAIYLVANVGYLAALGLDGMAAAAVEGAPGLATSLASRAFGEVGGRLLVLGMAISALGIAVVNVVTTPWMYVTLARQRLFFAGFGELNAHGAPTRALLLQLGATSLYLLSGQGDALVSSVSFVEWIFHGLAALALLSLRRTRPELPRPFRSPLYPLGPALYLLIAIGVVLGNLATSIAEERIGSVGIGLAVLGVGAIVFWPWSNAMARRSTPLD